MVKYITGMLLTAVILFSGAGALSLAQEDESLDYTWGIVKSVAPEQITIAEYDYEKSAEVNVDYAIDPGVKLQNVSSLKEVNIDDEVEIEFVSSGDKKVAKSLSVVKAPAEEPVPAAPAADVVSAPAQEALESETKSEPAALAVPAKQ